jgi:hypothetical protein
MRLLEHKEDRIVNDNKEPINQPAKISIFEDIYSADDVYDNVQDSFIGIDRRVLFN